MAFLRLLTIGFLCAAAAGCSIHPLTEDVTGYKTAAIVQKIRCEARDAIRHHILIALRRRGHADVADELERGITEWTVDRSRFNRETQRVLEKYDHAAIAYGFTFDITEKNHATGALDFLKPVTRGVFNLGFRATSQLERENGRNFIISDTFEKLVTGLPTKYCKEIVEGKNWVYPITGTIGLQELVHTFLDLNESGALVGKEGGRVPTIADTIEFRTTFSAGATPSIELSAVGRAFQLTRASLAVDATREDKHKVIVTLSLPDDPSERAPVRTAARTVARTAVRKPVDRLMPPARTSAEKRAVEEIYKQQDQRFYNRIDRLQRRLERLTD